MRPKTAAASTASISPDIEILRRAQGQNGARIGGDWIPKPYAPAEE